MFVLSYTLWHMIGDSFLYLKEYNEIVAGNKVEKGFEPSYEFFPNMSHCKITKHEQINKKSDSYRIVSFLQHFKE